MYTGVSEQQLLFAVAGLAVCLVFYSCAVQWDAQLFVWQACCALILSTTLFAFINWFSIKMFQAQYIDEHIYRKARYILAAVAEEILRCHYGAIC